MATITHPDSLHPTGNPSEPFLVHLWHEASETLHVWHDRAISRRELGKLDDTILHDIGLTRADVMKEIDKPFWQG